MDEPNDFVDERLARLASATASVRPSSGFDDWVVAAVERAAGPAWFDTVWRSGRLALAVGALAAVASVALAVAVRAELDEQVLTTFDMVEFDE